jgi:hypothetical protein
MDSFQRQRPQSSYSIKKQYLCQHGSSTNDDSAALYPCSVIPFRVLTSTPTLALSGSGVLGIRFMLVYVRIGIAC